MRKHLMCLFSTVLALLMGGCCFGNPTFIVSPGRVGPDHLKDEINKLKSLCNILPNGKCDETKLEIIGHGAGSFRHYPMDVTTGGTIVGNDNAKVKNFEDLLKTAFDNHNLDAIEIDAQLPPYINHELHVNNNPNTSFVMHNTPDWEKLTRLEQPKAFAYLQDNTLPKVLEVFTSRHYPEQGKKLYLELKSNNECANTGNTAHQCTDSPIRVAKDIEYILKSRPFSNRWLTVVSFSATSLETVHKTLGDRIDYALIAGYDTDGFLSIKARLAQCKGDVPKFDDDMKKFVANNKWISMVWFSTKGISDPTEELKEIIKIRQKEHPDVPLKFSVATYDRTWRGFYKKMADFPYPLASVMIDIDDYK